MGSDGSAGRRVELDTEARWQMSADLERVETHLRAVFTRRSDIPERLKSAMSHSLFSGGKRLRPILLIWTWRALNESADDPDDDILNAAAALEMIHTYSLIHDDLPAMDDDTLRRGQPTCHVAFDEATAILAGDGLQSLAFEILAGAGSRSSGLVTLLARNAGPSGMVGGQVLDLQAEGTVPDEAMISRIHGMKTACLISCAFAMAAHLSGRDQAEVRRLGEIGVTLGLAFQAADDLLDVTGDAASLGKTPGKDQEAGKATWVALEGFASAKQRTEALGVEGSKALRSFLKPGPESARILQLVDFLWTRDH
jgi:geranylgeranyl pyrophosphate synthase